MLPTHYINCPDLPSPLDSYHPTLSLSRTPYFILHTLAAQNPNICSPKWFIARSRSARTAANLQALAIDLLNRPADVQARTHKLKKVVPEPNSFFMDVKCPGCFQIT